MTDLTSTLIGFLSPSVNAFRVATNCEPIKVNKEDSSIECNIHLKGCKWNRMIITHNGLDLIDIVCYKVSTRLGKTTVKEIHRMENMYGDQVYPIFRETTGVATRLW